MSNQNLPNFLNVYLNTEIRITLPVSLGDIMDFLCSQLDWSEVFRGQFNKVSLLYLT